MSKPSLEEIKRQVEATKSRPLHALPSAWYENGVAERMSEWIKRSKGK